MAIPQVTVALLNSTVLESSGKSLVFTFTRTGDTSEPLTVNFEVSGTATNSLDFQSNLNLSSAPAKAWTKLLGSNGNEEALSMTIGLDGSIYIGGYTQGSIDGQLFNGGWSDAFITKYRPDGTKVWTKLLGTADTDKAYSLTTGIDGSIYISGYTEGNLDSQSNSGNGDAFITKYQSDGTKAWTKLFSSNNFENANAITTGLDGFIYVSGESSGISSDIYISKYRDDGSAVWTKWLGLSEGASRPREMATGLDGSIYLTGIANNDAFITKYQPDGTKVWSKLFGTSGFDIGTGLKIGQDGSIYVSGYTSGALNGQKYAGLGDAFVTKYRADGTNVWTKLFGTSYAESATCLSIGLDGSIYLGGYTLGSLDSQTNSGLNDIFYAKYQQDGNNVWIKLAGTISNDYVTAMGTGLDGSIYFSGQTLGNLDGQIINGTSDVYLTRLNFYPQVVFSAGSSTVSQIFIPISDFDVESNETITLSLAPGADYNFGTISLATGVIIDNRVPTASSISISINEDVQNTGTLIGSDLDGDSLNYLKVTNPLHGSIAISATGNYLYIPETNYSGLDNFIYKVNDGKVDSGTATVVITINSVNDTPTGSVTISGTATQGQVLTAGNNLADVDGLGSINYQWLADGVNISGATNATLTLTQAQVGKAITVKASYTDLGGTYETVTSEWTTNVANINDAPVTNAASITTNEDTAKTGTLTATDVDSTSLTFTKVASPSNGTVTVNSNGTYSYTPSDNFNGTDSFTFKANDGALDSAAATVSITVVAVNDAPVANAASITTNEDTAKTGTLTATDVDSTALTYSKVASPANGTVTVNTNGAYTYSPNANFNGTDSFTFKAFDGTDYSTAATVSITVNPVNDTPVGEIIYHGKFIEGQTISADISKITEPEGIGIPQYLWKRDSVIVKSGLSAYYTISDADIDHHVSVDVKYLDGGGTLETIKGSDVNKVTALGDLRGFNFNITQNINGVVVSGSVNLSQTFSKANSIALLFWKEGDQQTWVNLSRDSSGLFVFEQKLDKYASSGSYAVRAIDAVDDFGASIRFTEQKMIELGYQTKSVLDNPYSDSTKPAVKSFEISNFHFNDQKQTWDVDYKLSVTDDKSGLKNGHIVEFLSPTGASLQEWRDFNSDGVLSTTRSFSKYTASGIYKINTIRIWDIAGNDGTLGYVAINAGGLTSQLTLNNPYADNKSPTLDKFTLAATFNSVTLRPSIVIDFSAADDVSGFKNSYIRMADINGVLEDRWIEDQDSTKAGVQFNLDLVQEYTSGKFKIQYLNLYDNANNSSSLVSSDFLKSGFTPEINVFFKPAGASDDYVIKAMDSDDWLIGSSSNDILDGGKGQDVLYSGPGNDYVSAGTGDDLIVGGEGAGNDTYVGGTGTDTVKYTSAVNTILVNLLEGLANGQDIGTDKLAEIENLIGGQTGDTLIGDNNANNINAFTGNDTITGNGGNDTIDGGVGQDTVVYALNASSYTVTAITGGYQVVAKSGLEGTDTLLNVESMKFANKTVVAADFVAAGGEKDPAIAKFWKDNAKAPTETKKTDAVNLTDAIAILKMIVGLNVNSNNTPLSPYQAIAADFDQSGDVGLTDAIGVLKMVVGLSAPTPSWKYYDDTKLNSTYTSAQSLNPKNWTTTAVISDTGTADSSVKLVGVLTGDVDGSWTGV